MSKNYVPRQENLLAKWAANLSNKLSADPTAYGVTAEQAGELAGAVGSFGALYAQATDPDTRTKPNIAAKNTAKKQMLATIRPLVQTIQNWPGMTNAKRDLLRIPVRDENPSPIGPPEVMPILRVADVTGRVLDLEVRSLTDSGNSATETKRKPAGVRGVILYSYVGENPATDLRQWQYEGASTKSNPQIVMPETLAAGTAVWVTAAWMNPTDQQGPACAPVKTHIGFQGLSQAA
ncbi:MAG: hypothetical protein AAF710_00830 [Planctomycetota bacterium]